MLTPTLEACLESLRDFGDRSPLPPVERAKPYTLNPSQVAAVEQLVRYVSRIDEHSEIVRRTIAECFR